MGLRLLCEQAAEEQFPSNGKNNTLENFMISNFDVAKKNLTQDQKNTLHTQNVDKNKITGLLQSGAHAYTAPINIEQTIAMSIIIGKIIEYVYAK